MNSLSNEKKNEIKQTVDFLYFPKQKTYLDLYNLGNYIPSKKNEIKSRIMSYNLVRTFYIEIKGNYYEYTNLEVINFIDNYIDGDKYIGVDSMIVPSDFSFLILTNHDGDIFEITLYKES